jgi:hypothetical protein
VATGFDVSKLQRRAAHAAGRGTNDAGRCC